MQKNKPREILLKLENTEDLLPIIEEQGFEEYFNPVKVSAERINNRIEKKLSEFNKIKEIKKRVKTLDSILFKMLYIESTQDINRINDVVGLRAIVERIGDCYKLFHELLEAGFDPYFKIFDTLDKNNRYYRSLDINFLYGNNNCFQLQIRTPSIQKNYECGGDLSNEYYKKMIIKEAVQSLKKDELFGIDYRINLLDEIDHNFRKGYRNYRNLEPSKRYSLIRLLDIYSHEDLNYDKIGEIRLTRRTKKILRHHKDLIYDKEIFFPFKRLTARPSFRKIVKGDYEQISKNSNLLSFSEAVKN